MAALRRDVAVKPRRPGDGRHQQVLGAVAEDVPPDQAPRHVGMSREGRVLRRHVPEPAVAVPGEQLVAVPVLAPERPERRVVRRGAGRHPAVDDGQVEGPVVVEVRQHGPEAGPPPARRDQPGGGRVVPEPAPRALLPKGVGLLRQVRDEEVEQPVAVHVPQGHAHPGLGLTHPVVRDAALHRLLLERPVLLVHPEPVGRAVVGDENVRPAVAVEVGADHAQARPRQPAQARRLGDVLEADAGRAELSPLPGRGRALTLWKRRLTRPWNVFGEQ